MVLTHQPLRARWLAGLCACAVALASMNCDRRDRGHVDGSTLTVLDDGDEWRWPKFIVFLGLALPDENGRMQGRLAKSWDHSPDYSTWTYHLRTDVRWHDGMPVTAHDVKFTMDLLSHPDVLSRTPGSYSTAAPDDSTFVITYSKGAPRTSPEIGTVCFPKHLLKDLDPAKFRSWEFWTRPVGNGPYRYVRHVPRTSMEFETNPDYALGKPKISRLIVKFGPPSVTELLSGNVDAVSSFSEGANVLAIKDDPRFRVYYEVWDDILALQVILWNQRNPLFRDPRVRRALTHAINRRELHRVLNMWDKLPVVDGVYTQRQYWEGKLPQALPYDRELANTLLYQSGWRDLDGDGVRERDGREFRFSLIVGSHSEWQAAAVYVQSQLRQVGIRMDITTLEHGVLRGRMSAGEFDAVLELFWSQVGDLVRFLGKDSPIGYRNPRVARLLDATQNTRNPDEMDEIFRGLASVVGEDLPFTYLTLNVESYVAHRKVKGLSSPFRANPLWSAEHLWIEDER